MARNGCLEEIDGNANIIKEMTGGIGNNRESFIPIHCTTISLTSVNHLIFPGS